MPEEPESNESNEDNNSLNQAEVRKSKKSCCCTLRRTLIFCSVLFGNCVIFCLVILVIMGVLFSGLSSIRDVDYEGEPWPVTDEEGYYQSYKDNGSAWVNWWHRDIPSGLTIMAGFAFNEDQSNIPRASELDKTLPVSKPYWLNDSEPIDQKDSTKDNLKATWIGHATVLAKIDGATVLTDPIFSQRCFPVQWAGPKRYRPPACTVQELPEIVDAVVISHTHYDHLDLNSVKQLHQRSAHKMENLFMLQLIVMALVLRASTSTAYPNSIGDYSGSNPNSRFPWLQRPIFYESPERAAPAEEEINNNLNNNEINNESNQVETRQMPSYADVGRFLLKRNVDILNDPRFLNCINEMDIVNHPAKLMPAYARCASVIGRPRFGKRSGPL